ncbi:restriction endonuclease subunit S [Odoribacter sp. OF09-27XD]|nr:restriction endonuclease subunit S [Odoribacter sp. OF09-27XD]RHV88240.1 restriction endonuclease subunit S [Odoribacter sp. OF09-27XD]
MDTKKLRQKILDLAIRGKLVPQDPNDEPASVLLERIKAEKERLIKEGKIKKSKKSAKTSDTPHYENVPFEVPNNWVWTTIENICSKIGSGSTPKGSNYSSNGIIFFRSQNVHNDGIVLDDIKYISKEVHKSMIGTEVLPNDLLLNITGGSLGRCTIVPNMIDRGNVSQHVCILRPILVKAEYLHIFILSSFFAKTMKITGSGREGLPKYNLEKMFLPLPPLEEQKGIMVEIERWFALIGQIEQGKSDLQTVVNQAKNKILDLAIHGKLIPQDPNDEPASELLKRINPKAEITCDNGHYKNLPDSWCVVPMQMLCSLTDGEKQSGIERIYLDVKYLRGEHDTKMLTAGKYAAANSLLVLVDGENSGEVFRTPIEGYQGSTFKQLTINSNMNTDYILQVINSHRKTLRENKVGSAIPHLNKKLFRAIEVPIPPYNEQQRIVNAINVAYKHLDAIMKNL